MPKSYPVEFRFRAIALARAGKSIIDMALKLGISKASLYTLVNQDQVDSGHRPGLPMKEHGELVSGS